MKSAIGIIVGGTTISLLLHTGNCEIRRVPGENIGSGGNYGPCNGRTSPPVRINGVLENDSLGAHRCSRN